MSILGTALKWAFTFRAVSAWLHRHPYGHLFNSKGLYMGRWSVVATGTRASKLLSFVTRGRYDHVRLHWINQPDADRELHNHPFKYRTFVLSGWYEEVLAERIFTPTSSGRGFAVTNCRMLGAGCTAEGGGYHRIHRVSSGGVFTLFFMGGDTGEWGFLVDGKHVPSKDFFKLRGIRADGNKA